ncbi:MAG: SGNH/GDSL hydrolase family protein [Dehalococcoidia bacterium]
MRLLILGESDSIGMALRDPSIAWGNRIPIEIEQQLGEAPETIHVRFYSWGAGTADYLAKVLESGPFDAVVISTTKVGFTIYSADNRVRKVFGNRVGDAFKNSVKAVDRRTLRRQPPGWKRSMNQAGHRLARKIIGQAPVTTPEAVARGYIETFATLARLEDTHVVVVLPPALPSPAARRRPKLAAAVDQFRRTMREEAVRRRFAVVDAMPLMPAPGPDRDRLFTDDVHKTPELHLLLGRVVAQAIIDGLGAGNVRSLN